MQPYDHITVKTVATLLGRSESSIWRLVKKDPDFPLPIKIGGSTRFSRAEIDRITNQFPNRFEVQKEATGGRPSEILTIKAEN